MIRGRLIFNDTLRRPDKVRELALAYSMIVPLACEFRDAFCNFYWQTTLVSLIGHNPQMLLPAPEGGVEV